MKMIKRLTTILFTIMMVLATTNMVFAAGTGSITINNAIKDQTYNIYKIMELESFNGDNYAYKLSDTNWIDFIKNTDRQQTIQIIDETNGIVKWIADKTDSTVQGFAKKALAYAKTKNLPATDTIVATSTTVTFNFLELGYYLVDSSAGALCNLTTTDEAVTIEEKNSAPTVVKNVNTLGGVYSNEATHNIGVPFSIRITITVGKGAQNYVLHDKADPGLTIDTSTIRVSYKNTMQPNNNTFYKVVTTGLEGTDPCNFHIEFLDYSRLTEGDTINVYYIMHLNKDANLYYYDNFNKAWLTYGDENVSTAESKINVQTLQFQLFKYTDVAGIETPLAGVKFKLTDKNGDVIRLIKSQDEDTTIGAEKYLTYRPLDKNETGGVEEFITPSLGKITIKGLAAGKYYLTEIEAPKGYNKLNKDIEIEINSGGAIEYKERDSMGPSSVVSFDEFIKIENKTGTILPSTGGVGTTMMYIVGAALLIGSGVLLITKKNAK